MKIIKSAFFPFGDVDKEKDGVYASHLNQISENIRPDDPALQINKKFQKQSPWKLAQKGLYLFYIYLLSLF
jgi:hypothetical protein